MEVSYASIHLRSFYNFKILKISKGGSDFKVNTSLQVDLDRM